MALEGQPHRMHPHAQERENFYNKVAGMNEKTLSARIGEVTGYDKNHAGVIPGDDLTVTHEVYESVIGLDETAERMMGDERVTRIHGLPASIPDWERDAIGRPIYVRSENDENPKLVGTVMPADAQGQQLIVLNNGLVCIGEQSPQMGDEAKAALGPSIFPFPLVATAENIYDGSGVLKDETANDVLKVIERKGLVITKYSDRPDHTPDLDEKVDHVLRWVDSVKERREREVETAYIPLVEHVEGLLKGPKEETLPEAGTTQ